MSTCWAIVVAAAIVALLPGTSAGCGSDAESGPRGQGGSAGDGGLGALGGSGGDGGLGGQGGVGGACGDPAVVAQFPACQSAEDQPSCEAAGGEWTDLGGAPEFYCRCATGQGECTCDSSSQCLGKCAAPLVGWPSDCEGVTQGTCSSFAPALGCECWFDDFGGLDGGCIG